MSLFNVHIYFFQIASVGKFNQIFFTTAAIHHLR